MINTILLGILVLFATIYFVNALRPDSKKAYFKRRINATTKEIWENEYKVEKSLQVKEGIRQDRDRIIDARYKAEAALKATPDDKQLIEEIAGFNETIKRYEAQMVMIDKQVNGVAAEGNDPGEQGLQDIISALAESRAMLKDYVAKL